MFRYLFCLLLLLLPQVSFADVRLAVLEFRGTGLGESGLRILSDKVREGVLSVSQGKVNGQKLIIMTRENMMQVLKDQGLSAENCTGACEVEVAKNIGADYVISGEVSMFDGLYIVTIKLHQTSNSSLMGTQTIETEKKRELLSEVKTVGANIFRDGLNITRPSQPRNATQTESSSMISGDGYEAVLISSGRFTMGCTSGDSGCGKNETPRHTVTLTRSFYMMKSEVTQGLYESVMGKNPSGFSGCGSTCPVETVSLVDAVQMANQMSKEEDLEACYRINGESVFWPNRDCEGWRLPTEAEWEYAARGGESYKYAGSNTVGDTAWYKGNSGKKTHSVCGKKENGYGLCDMSGNVWEWVWDIYGDYASASVRNPTGKTSGSLRVARGGSWFNDARVSRISYRLGDFASLRSDFLGFRLVRFN